MRRRAASLRRCVVCVCVCLFWFGENGGGLWGVGRSQPNPPSSLLPSHTDTHLHPSIHPSIHPHTPTHTPIHPKQVTPATTSRLRWVLPLRVLPPLDSDPTDLLLDHDLRRCATELLV